MINYYDDIDYLEFRSQLDFISESIEILAINEGIGSRISNIFKGIGNFITKVKDWISGVIGKVFNKDKVKYTVIENQTDSIISQSKGGEIPIKEENKAKVAEKINNITEQVEKQGDNPSNIEKTKLDNKPNTVKDVSDKYKENPDTKPTETPKQDTKPNTVKDVSDKYKEKPDTKPSSSSDQTEKTNRTNKTKYSVNIIFRNTKRFEECLYLRDKIENIMEKSIDFININRSEILKGDKMEKFDKFEEDNNITDILKKINKLQNPASIKEIWEYAHFDDVNDIKIVKIIKDRIKLLKRLNSDIGLGLHKLDKNFDKFRQIVKKLEKDMDALYGEYLTKTKETKDHYIVVDIFTDIRYKTKGYIETTRFFIKNMKYETDNLWKMISIIKSGIAPLEKEPESGYVYNDKYRGINPQEYIKHKSK